jgi:hypothetical protein
MQALSFPLSQGGNRHHTATAQMRQERALRRHGLGSRHMVQRRQQRIDLVIHSALHRQGALSDGWQHYLNGQQLGHFRLQS